MYGTSCKDVRRNIIFIMNIIDVFFGGEGKWYRSLNELFSNRNMGKRIFFLLRNENIYFK